MRKLTAGSTKAPVPHRFRTKRLYVSLLAVGVMGGAPWAFTHAIFTDEESNASVLATGTLDISDSPQDAVITTLNMAPGDITTAPLTIANDGSLDLRYAMTTDVAGTSEDAGLLSTTMKLRVREDVADCTDGGFGATGSNVYAGALSDAAFGDTTQGGQPGDRLLASGSDEVLCLQVELPVSAGNILQAEDTTATFTFFAEQTANNQTPGYDGHCL
ncbi:TasA family protein, partial [Nocardioides sp.]|uniref:TasA family protein n=1 Tax=Nocardioides sp. TaxID=35761 RepID=UPI002B265F72